MPYDVSKIRKQLKEKMSNRPQDPFEFRPPKAKDNNPIKIRFYVLPPLSKGDPCNGGVASRDMEMFAIKHGSHWVNNRPYPCPRVNRDEGCELCEAGFEMLKETDEKDKRQAIVRQWLAQSVFLVNLYFPNIASNPEDVRGKVLFFNGPKTCFDHWYAAVNRDTGGDETDPEAYGVFFDENAAFLYQLEITQSGSWNSYKTSKFLASLGAQPIAKTKEGAVDAKRIQSILDQRHDLWLKVEETDPSKIHRLCAQMLHGDIEDDALPGAEAPEGELPATEGTTAAEGVEEEIEPVKKSAAAPAKPAAAKSAPAKPATVAKPAAAKTTVAKPTAKVEEAEEELLEDVGAGAVEATPAPAKPAAAKPVAAPSKLSAAPAKPAPAAKTTAKPVAAQPAAAQKPKQPVIEADDDGDDNIDGLLAKLAPNAATGGEVEEAEVAAE